MEREETYMENNLKTPSPIENEVSFFEKNVEHLEDTISMVQQKLVHILPNTPSRKDDPGIAVNPGVGSSNLYDRLKKANEKFNSLIHHLRRVGEDAEL